MNAEAWKRFDQERALEAFLAPRQLLGRLMTEPMGDQLGGADLRVLRAACPDAALVASGAPVTVRDALRLLTPATFRSEKPVSLVASAVSMDRRPVARRPAAKPPKAPLRDRLLLRRPRAKTLDEQLDEFLDSL